jgi:hypothetical protein
VHQIDFPKIFLGMTSDDFVEIELHQPA